MAGTLKVSNKIWAAVSRLERGFRGGSVRSTGCYGVLAGCVSARPPGFEERYLFAIRFQPLFIHICPNLFHVVPICDDAVLQRIMNLEQPTKLSGRLLADENISLECAR